MGRRIEAKVRRYAQNKEAMDNSLTPLTNMINLNKDINQFYDGQPLAKTKKVNPNNSKDILETFESSEDNYMPAQAPIRSIDDSLYDQEKITEDQKIPIKAKSGLHQ